MRFTQITLTAALAAAILAAPVPQGAGVGAGCDSIFTDTDTMIGEITRTGGQQLANKLPNSKRQGAGVGAGCNSVFTDTDTMIGEISRTAGQQLANKLPSSRRQLNGISDGIAAVIEKVPGASTIGKELDSQGNSIDGVGTDGSAQVGQSIGNTELGIADSVDSALGGSSSGGSGSGSGSGSPPPPPPPGGPKGPKGRRQLNGISDGVAAVIEKVPGLSGVGEELDSQGNSIDGVGTDGSAQLGAAIGNTELGIANSVDSALGGSSSGGGSGSGSPPPPPPPPGPKRL